MGQNPGCGPLKLESHQRPFHRPGARTRSMSDDPAKFAPDRRGLGLLKTLGLEVQHVFDVGACKGEWTRHIRMDLPDATFDMFEPLADHAPELGALLQQNLDSPTVRLHKFALGADNKMTRMFLYPDNL